MMDRKQELDTLWKDKGEDMKNQVIEMPVPVQVESDAMLSIIEKMACNPDFDVVKMQALVDMRTKEFERLEEYRRQELARVAKQEFNTDYVPMSNELPLITKTKTNKHTSSSYAAIEDVNEAIKPVLTKYGFGISCNVLGQTKADITVEAILLHRGGHEKRLKLVMPIDNAGTKGERNKTDIQGIASSITYSKRVAICTLLNISTGDDKDGNQPSIDPSATEIQRAAISSILKKLTQQEQDKFNADTGGVLEIKKKDVDSIIASLNKIIKDRLNGNN